MGRLHPGTRNLTLGKLPDSSCLFCKIGIILEGFDDVTCVKGLEQCPAHSKAHKDLLNF